MQQTPVGDAPRIDHHQHLFSPAITELLGGGFEALEADDLVVLLDAAGIGRALLLSVAYMYGSPARSVEDEQARVRAENDWTAAQAARHPGRLLTFAAFNPLRPYALDELARCAADPQRFQGLKFHFGNSDVQLDDPAHVAQLGRVFEAANRHRMPIVVHLRPSVAKQRPYGAEQARSFLEQLLPLAPDIVVQVAHLAGTGPGYDDPPSDAAMAVLAEAVALDDPRSRQLWFDASGLMTADMPDDEAQQMAHRIRQVGAGRVLYGSDAAVGGNLAPRESWAAFRRLPLSEAELEQIAGNVAPYMSF